ncbi:MAG: cytochrome P460 family protein [Thermoleophilia bacterium]|nr:cytochrome P460 family protein [Thermoleophilia bacterium]
MRSGVRWSTTIAGAVVASLLAAGCGGAADDDATVSAPATTGVAPTPGLPPQTAGFATWPRLNSRPIAESPDTPHGDDKVVRLNRDLSRVVRDGRLVTPLPPGTVVLKTGRRGSDAIAFVSVMEKVPDYDPQHGDWRFTEYARTAPDAAYTPLAEASACWDCHASVAKDRDWVFTEPD